MNYELMVNTDLSIEPTPNAESFIRWIENNPQLTTEEVAIKYLELPLLEWYKVSESMNLNPNNSGLSCKMDYRMYYYMNIRTKLMIEDAKKLGDTKEFREQLAKKCMILNKFECEDKEGKII